MRITLVMPKRVVIVWTVMLLAVALLIAAGEYLSLARVGASVLEFVGNLISSFHSNLWSRLDPTYSHCF